MHFGRMKYIKLVHEPLISVIICSNFQMVLYTSFFLMLLLNGLIKPSDHHVVVVVVFNSKVPT